jgi:flagellar biosynthesis/type III secretory pathway protein FliH
VRFALAVACVLLLIGAAATVAFFIGQTTRMSDAEVTVKVASAVAERGDRAERDQEAALAEQADRNRKRTKRVRVAARNRGYRVGKRSGYQDGQSDGYASGQAAGYSSGHSAGTEEGIEKASDELACSDDSDVNLPPCWIYDY